VNENCEMGKDKKKIVERMQEDQMDNELKLRCEML
jgi:hypothetical protein